MKTKTIIRKQILFWSMAILMIIGSCTQAPVTLVPDSIAEVKLLKSTNGPVRSGLEVFLESVSGADSLKYGLLTNQTCVNRNLVHGVELLPAKIDLQLILSPEHGLFGAENAGDNVENETDPETGIKSLSTYRKKPAGIAEMISDLDVVLFDIQDIGVRSYTYISSMAYLMQAAAIAGKKVIILDRPNPINGIQMEGNILDPEFTSFVGIYPLPYRHGMTIGELALLFNAEYGINCDLQVVAMEGWTRSMWYEDTGLPWVPTSPHVPDASTILPMIATGTYGELGMLSEGVGTTIPFEYTGGPWIKDPHAFARAMQARAGEGVIYRPTFFKPYYGRHKGEVCGGLQLYVTDRDLFSPYLVGLVLMSVHQELYPEINLFENENRFDMFAKVMGTDDIRVAIQQGADPKVLEHNWEKELLRFGELRKKYLLYD
ncbi:MAG: DUF1343 domain-containing protein [Candidatus Marinimicrobia bacterium]|nr:DUF1343 domain-containing protein [Candidatus Neomarinimicrobiota bacterium]